MSIRFTDSGLILKGTATAYLQDTTTNNIVFCDDAFQTANVQTSLTQGEIRGGIGNPIIAMIPSDSSLTVNFVTAHFNLAAKAGQTGAKLTYGAPVMVCQTVVANSASLTIDVTGGAPVAAIGASEAVCFVQEVGASSAIATDGVAYPISGSGVVSGFTATPTKTYKVWYNITRANAQLATVSSLFEPAVYRFTAVMAVYDMAGASGANQGTHVGNLTIVVPRLKLGGDAGGVTGDQTTADTTSITGQALAYSPTTIDGDCDDCSGGGNPFAYYIYTPCDTTSGIEGIVAQLGGVIEMVKSTTYQMRPMAVVNGELVRNIAPADFTYAVASGGTSTVSTSGLITAASTAEDTEVVVTYSAGSGVTFTDTVNLTVTST